MTIRRCQCLAAFGTLRSTSPCWLEPSAAGEAAGTADLVTAKINCLSLGEVAIINTRNCLIQAVTNPDNGIVSILGDEREEARSVMCQQIFILSRNSSLFMDTFMNLLLTGGSGTGKTKLANVVGYVFQKLGVLLTDNVLVLSPASLVSMWVGSTAGRTMGVLMKGLEGVVFIDEAYQIARAGKQSHGDEALGEIVNFLDKYIGLSVVIVAGYKDEMMKNFLGANEGLARRFPLRLDLSNYTPADLFNIFWKTVHANLPAVELDTPLKRYTAR